MSKAKKPSAREAVGLTFDALVLSIRDIDRDLATQAKRAVNAGLTIRNWLIGWRVEEYERHGVDRAQYGEKLMDRLAEELARHEVSRSERSELYRYRTFYFTCPKNVETLSPQFKAFRAPSGLWLSVFPTCVGLSDRSIENRRKLIRVRLGRDVS